MTGLASETIKSMLYTRIIESLSQMHNISVAEAIELFYNSRLFTLIEDKVADLHCRSEKYLAEEIWREYHAEDR